MSDARWNETRASSCDDIVDLLQASTAVPLTVDPELHHLLDHSLQTAAVLHRSHPADLELQLAGLVHDVGHMLGSGDDDLHGEVAAAFVEPVLGRRVAALVRLHVPAKRYLVTTEPHYRQNLDALSIVSLEHQGGDMDPDEMADFESEESFLDALALRRADEAGKVPDLVVPGLDTWLVPLRRHNSHERG